MAGIGGRRDSTAKAPAPAQDSTDSVFAAFDTDGNARLDFEEFVAMQPACLHDMYSEDDMRAWYDEADDNGDGTLSINEFFQWSLTKSSAGGGGAAILEAAFKKYDPNGSGSLDIDEFKQMARDMGFGYMANEAFAVLDDDSSGYITFKELLASLMEKTPRNTETKKLLFGCIWAWGQEQASPKKRPPIDTSKWKIKGQDALTVREELRALLKGSGRHITELCPLFDEDNTGNLTIDDIEFMKVLKKWGFRGIPSILDDVFESINTSGTGTINYDEFFEFVRGHRHALDHRERNAIILQLHIDVPPGASFSLVDMAWDVEPSAYESVESMRLLMQQMLLLNNCSPTDLMRAWDRSGDKQLDKREFVINIKKLFRAAPELWKREVHRVAEAAFGIIQDDGMDVNASAMDIIELEEWLDRPTRRKPDRYSRMQTCKAHASHIRALPVPLPAHVPPPPRCSPPPRSPPAAAQPLPAQAASQRRDQARGAEKDANPAASRV